MRSRRQHSVFTRRQAVAQGFSESQIDHRLRTGQWIVVVRGVYASALTELTPLVRLHAALLAEPRAFASRETAASLWGFGGYRLAAPLQLSRLGASPRQMRGVHLRRTNHQPDVVTVDDVRRTSRADTIIDLAGLRGMTDRRLLWITKEACRAPELSSADIVARLREGHRGVRRLRDVLELLGTERASRSVSEAEFQHLLKDLRAIVPPVFNVNRRLSNGQEVEFDVLFPAERLVLEFDGPLDHDNPEARIASARRDEQCRLDGIDVARWRDEALFDPVTMLADTARRLRDRGDRRS